MVRPSSPKPPPAASGPAGLGDPTDSVPRPSTPSVEPPPSSTLSDENPNTLLKRMDSARTKLINRFPKAKPPEETKITKVIVSNDEDLKNVLTKNPDIKEITLKGDKFTSEGLESLKGLKKLEAVNVSNPLKSGKGIVASIAHNCSGLKKLSVEGGRLSIDGSVVKDLADNCPNLTHVDLKNCPDVTDESVIRLAEKCPNLVSLEVSDCRQLTDKSINAVAEKCGNLKYLGVGGINLSGKCIKNFVNQHPDVLGLNIGNCKNVDDDLVMHVAGHCPKLTQLNLMNTKITDESVMCLAEKCPDLMDVNLLRTGVGDGGLRHLVRNCEKLSNLNLAYCGNINPSSIVYAAEKRNLTDLNIKACKDIDNEVVEEIARHSPELRSLAIRGSSVDGGLKHLADKCPKLDRLELWGCPVSDETAQDVMENRSDSMRELTLVQCPNISNATRDSIRANYPNCKLYSENQ